MFCPHPFSIEGVLMYLEMSIRVNHHGLEISQKRPLGGIAPISLFPRTLVWPAPA